MRDFDIFVLEASSNAVAKLVGTNDSGGSADSAVDADTVGNPPIATVAGVPTVDEGVPKGVELEPAEPERGRGGNGGEGAGGSVGVVRSPGFKGDRPAGGGIGRDSVDADEDIGADGADGAGGTDAGATNEDTDGGGGTEVATVVNIFINWFI